MRKIPTLFQRNPKNIKLVTRNINPETAWLFGTEARPSVKRDGTNVCVHVLNGAFLSLEKRRNPTREEKANGAEPGYVAANRADPADRHIFAAVDATDFSTWPDGAWPAEALGPKIQGGVESDVPMLYPFSWNPTWIEEDITLSFDGIRAFLEGHEIEGIVWHEPGGQGRMCKVKRRDFDLPWPANKGKKA